LMSHLRLHVGYDRKIKRCNFGACRDKELTGDLKRHLQTHKLCHSIPPFAYIRKATFGETVFETIKFRADGRLDASYRDVANTIRNTIVAAYNYDVGA
jgi:hypothetical protein